MPKNERGFTLVELLVAMVVTSIVLGAFGSLFYHVLTMPIRQGDHLTAENELRFTLDLIQADGVQARSFTYSNAPYYGYFSWDYFDPGLGGFVTYRVYYKYDGGMLIREQSLDSSSAVIARHIVSASDVDFDYTAGETKIAVTITVTVDNGSGHIQTASGTRNVQMRVAP